MKQNAYKQPVAATIVASGDFRDQSIPSGICKARPGSIQQDIFGCGRHGVKPIEPLTRDLKHPTEVASCGETFRAGWKWFLEVLCLVRCHHMTSARDIDDNTKSVGGMW